MTVKEMIAALQQCHPDAPVYFDIDTRHLDKTKVAVVQHNVMGWRERGDEDNPGTVNLHNYPTYFFDEEENMITEGFVLT